MKALGIPKRAHCSLETSQYNRTWGCGINRSKHVVQSSSNKIVMLTWIIDYWFILNGLSLKTYSCLKYVFCLTQLSVYFIISIVGYYFRPGDGLFRPKVVAKNWNNKIKTRLCLTECIFYFILIFYFKHNGMSCTKILLAYLIRQEKWFMWVTC